MNNQKTSSYTAASTFPAKLLRYKEECFIDDKIIPYHLQLCPTNTCNLNCSFCSCSKREKNQELDISTLKSLLLEFKYLGSKAVTITGGGEPCCYKDLPELLNFLDYQGFETGLVSNGILLNKIEELLFTLMWCRISVSDDRNIDQLFSILKPLVENIKIDWSFSYVVTSGFNPSKCAKVIRFANEHDFTHVRLVSDLMDLESIPFVAGIKFGFYRAGVDDSLVIYQDRQEYSKGNKKCLISLLKPVIAPDGFIYPCCGVQYALPNSEGIFPEQLRMCSIEEVIPYFTEQKVFDGSICRKCYYENYNTLLNICTSNYDHKRFV